MDKKAKRLKRKIRVRKKVFGTEAKPRLCIFRSSRYTYAQIINDDKGEVLINSNTKSLDLGSLSSGCKDAAKKLGEKIAQDAKEKNIDSVVFDRNGFVYHGRVAAVCEGAREGGLKV